MNFKLLVLFLGSLSAINIDKSSKMKSKFMEEDPGNLPTIIYGGMGSKCTDEAYVNLVAKLKEGLKQPVECYETTVLTSIKK